MMARRLGRAVSAGLCAVSCACSTTTPLAPNGKVQLPQLTGWFDGLPVVYVTTDVSDADVARDKGANYAPRLADALPPLPKRAGQPSAIDKVYAVTNFAQGSVFASAPEPMGFSNRDAAYSPLWQLVVVTWQPGRAPRVLKSEEEVLGAADAAEVTLAEKRVVLNCPIVHRGALGGLPGVATGESTR